MSTSLLEPPLIGRSADGRRKRLLLIAYNFPPVGGAGVQRPVKWAKYLGRFGWDVTVLTTLNPSVPALDHSLLAEVPAEVNVVRARTWEPDYSVKRNLVNPGSAGSRLIGRLKGAARDLAKRCIKLALQPDPQVLWNHHAIRLGTRALHDVPHDAILVTAPAFSSFFIGAALKRRFGLPLVLDYRDEWDLSGRYLENAHRDWLSSVVQSRMQRRLLRTADAVVATTRRSTDALAEKLRDLRHSIPACCVYNGYDADDFAASGPPAGDPVPAPAPGVFRLVYTGTLWNLTDIQPLVRGIESLDSSHPELTRHLELVCVGRKTADQQAVLHRLDSTSARLVDIDYCDHTTALQWMRTAHGLCLLLSDVPGAERVVPAKLFEYLAARKDLLAICPAGETAEIVSQFAPDGRLACDQPGPIAEWLRQRLSRASTGFTPVERDAPHDYSREAQTHRLAELLDSLVWSR